MSYNVAKMDFTIEASADLSAEQFRAVTVVAGGAAVAGLDAADIVGILQNNPDAAGQAGAAISRGDRLVSDANGDLIPVGANNNPIATALEDASGAGSIIAVVLD